MLRHTHTQIAQPFVRPSHTQLTPTTGNRQLCEILQLKLQKFSPAKLFCECQRLCVCVCVKNGQIATNMAHINYDKMALMSSVLSHPHTHAYRHALPVLDVHQYAYRNTRFSTSPHFGFQREANRTFSLARSHFSTMWPMIEQFGLPAQENKILFQCLFKFAYLPVYTRTRLFHCSIHPSADILQLQPYTN